MSADGYTIRFTFPDVGHPVYACDHKGAMGWGGLSAALMWDNPETPARFLENGYGSSKRWGEVVLIADGEVAARWEDEVFYPVLSEGWVNV